MRKGAYRRKVLAKAARRPQKAQNLTGCAQGSNTTPAPEFDGPKRNWNDLPIASAKLKETEKPLLLLKLTGGLKARENSLTKRLRLIDRNGNIQIVAKWPPDH
jgi:hypothetical protein